MTNEEGMVEDIEIEAPLGSSDHAVLNVSFKCKQESQSAKIFYQYDRTDFSRLGEMLDIE